MKKLYRWLYIGLLLVLSGSQPAAAQKPEPPPTPAAATAAPPAATPVPKPVDTPAPEKPTAPPTPTPEPPTPEPEKPTAPPTPTAAPTDLVVVVIPATPPPGAAPVTAQTPTPLKATPEPLMPLPLATASLTVTEVITATTVVTRPHPVRVVVQQVQERIAALPVWAQVTGLGVLALLLVGGVALALRFVHYTRQDLTLKRQQLTADESAQVAARRTEVTVRLTADEQAWRAILAQIITDALGTAVRLVPNVDATLHTDPPQFSVTDVVTQTVYQFIPTAPPRKTAPGTQVYPLTDPQARAEVLAVWNHLVHQQLNGVAPALPRQAPWTLHYLPATPSTTLKVR